MRPIAGVLALLAAALALLAAAVFARAQPISRPWLEWRTIETPHFRVHYPAELEAWTRPTAARLESVHDAVTAFVGYTPEERITVVVDDPQNLPNGSAWRGGLIILWPTPPDPTSILERHRGWGEILSVHELTHVVHIERPPRNPRERFLIRLLPEPLRPALVGQRWVLEGYATLVEGRLTGAGRPHGAWRPAVLRRWALEGKLPTYDRLSAIEGFYQAEMAYLVGSAYLEWLVAQKGDESLPHLWRRLTARRSRSFDEGFAGVFGGPPDELYGRFVAQTTGEALEAVARLTAAGLVEGEPIQRLDGWTDDPAVSPDGKQIAIVRRPERDEPAEIVVWTTALDTLMTKEREEERRALAKDPEDVPDVEWRPRPKRAVARLGPVGGRGHMAPRWLPDGERILVARFESEGDGVLRPDLFEWRWRSGDLRRVTRGSGVREADPDPDGRTAVGTRCLLGACDLVRVDLTSGEVRVLAAGEPDGVTYAGARVAPDGRILASVRAENRWRIGLFDPDGRLLRYVDPDDGAVRFGASFLTGGEAIVAVSDRSGVLELERIELERGGMRQLTRTTGASIAPAPDPASSGIYFLSLTTHGFDLRRIDPDSVDTGPLVALDPSLSPVAPVPPVSAPEFPPSSTSSHAYGLGNREHAALPLGQWAPEGWSAGLVVHESDPVGRLGWVLGAMAGAESAWRGASAGAVWRGLRPRLRGDVFWARQRPSEQSFKGAAPPLGVDVELAGGSLALELERDFVSRRWLARVGASAARLERPGIADVTRTLGYAELSHAWRYARGPWRATAQLSLHGAAGKTAGEDWTRWVATTRVAVGGKASALAVELLRGQASAGSATFEEFAFGGVPSPLVPPEVLSQRLEESAVPVGYAVGANAESIRLEWIAGGLTTYYRWLRGDGSKWKRVTGIEVAFDTPPLPFLTLPAARVRLGLGRSLDPPFENDNRFYLGLSYEP